MKCDRLVKRLPSKHLRRAAATKKTTSSKVSIKSKIIRRNK